MSSTNIFDDFDALIARSQSLIDSIQCRTNSALSRFTNNRSSTQRSGAQTSSTTSTAVPPRTRSQAHSESNLLRTPTSQEINHDLEQIHIILNTVDRNLNDSNHVIDLTEMGNTPVPAFNNGNIIDLCSPDFTYDLQTPPTTAGNRNTHVRRRSFLQTPGRHRRSRSPVTTSAAGRNSSAVTRSNNGRKHTTGNVKTVEIIHSEEDTAVHNTGENRQLMCPVCMDSFISRQPTTTKCGHVFCGACINEAIKLTHKCPICNQKLSNKGISRIYL